MARAPKLPYTPEEARRRVLEVVARIPPGKVASYGQVAWEAGLPGRARLVGRVLSECMDSQRLPWHRVINAQGLISIPKSSLMHAEQRQRLIAEGVPLRNGRVRLSEFGWQPRSPAPLLD
jgi:methylated-DNA-protein-cysteine methyltransferase related protein